LLQLDILLQEKEMTGTEALTPAGREEALRRVLESEAFARSEQLKNFLRYVCKLEIEGRADEIKEYSIGVDALGRPPSYSPTADSSVRRRAFELRQKLEEVYANELADCDIRIDLPKGSYVPVFRLRTEPVAEPAAPAPMPAATPAIPPAPPPASGNGWARMIIAGIAGVALGAGAFWLAAGPARTGDADPPVILKEAWGPLAGSQANVLICIASNFHMMVRPGGFSSESGLPTFPAPPEIYPHYRKSNPLPEGAPLLMRPSANVASLGVVGGVAAASSTLRALGAQYQILPERTAPLASFRNRNVMLFGDPLNSFAAAQLMNRAHLTIAHDPVKNRLVIRDKRKPPTDPPAFSRREGRPGDPAEVYGLLTVLPADATPGENRRTLVVSGVSQVGVQGAVEFFASPERLLELKRHFQKDGLSGFPQSYQLVVRCTADDSLPLSCGYAAHHVLEP
jgi:hypothetical protein